MKITEVPLYTWQMCTSTVGKRLCATCHCQTKLFLSLPCYRSTERRNGFVSLHKRFWFPLQHKKTGMQYSVLAACRFTHCGALRYTFFPFMEEAGYSQATLFFGYTPHLEDQRRTRKSKKAYKNHRESWRGRRKSSGEIAWS